MPTNLIHEDDQVMDSQNPSRSREDYENDNGYSHAELDTKEQETKERPSDYAPEETKEQDYDSSDNDAGLLPYEFVSEAFRAEMGNMSEEQREVTEQVLKALDEANKHNPQSEPETKKISYKDLDKNVNDLVKTTINSWDKLTSEDPVDITTGTLEIISSMSALLGPEVHLIVAPICSIICALIKRKEEDPVPIEVVFGNIVKDLLDLQTDEEARAAVEADLDLLDSQRIQLDSWTGMDLKTLTNAEGFKLRLGGNQFELAGSKSLSTLSFYINKNMNTTDEAVAFRVARLIGYYCTLMNLRNDNCLKLTTLYGMLNWQVLCFSTAELLKKFKVQVHSLLNPVCNRVENESLQAMANRFYNEKLNLAIFKQPIEYRRALNVVKKYSGSNTLEGQLLEIKDYEGDAKTVFRVKRNNNFIYLNMGDGSFLTYGKFDNNQLVIWKKYSDTEDVSRALWNQAEYNKNGGKKSYIFYLKHSDFLKPVIISSRLGVTFAEAFTFFRLERLPRERRSRKNEGQLPNIDLPNSPKIPNKQKLPIIHDEEQLYWTITVI